MHKLIDFYERIPAKENGCYQRGHFFWTCFPYAFFSPRVTRFWNNKPTETIDITEFNPSKEEYDPNNHTEADMFLAINTYKRRPVVLLSSQCQSFDPKGLHGGEYFLVAPLRSLRILETNEYRHKPDFIWNTINYKYNSIFYIPSSDEGTIRESIIFFERMTTLHLSWLIPFGDIRLSSDAMACLDMWLRNYIYGTLPSKFNQNLEDYRKLMGEDPKTKRELIGTAKYLRDQKNK